MAQDGEAVVTQMRGQLRQYEAKLEEAERLASVDSLTGLANRRRMEAVLDLRVEQRKPFAVLIFDLNGFKQVNDTYGRSEEHTSELQSLRHLVCRLLLEKKNT